MRILFVGDVVGMAGRRALKTILPSFITSNNIDTVIINGENACHGLGCSEKVTSELTQLGCDCITLGNHTFSNKDFVYQIRKIKNCVRPANFTPSWPGNDYYVIDKNGFKIGVINLLGQVNMGLFPDNPYSKADELISILKDKEKCNSIVVDFHSETTSEKQAMGFYLDGKVSLVVGTHTHVQTADNRVLPNGTGYITDVGMCGAIDSVLGMDIETSLNRLAYKMSAKYEPANGPAYVNGIICEVDNDGRCLDIRRVCEYE